MVDVIARARVTDIIYAQLSQDPTQPLLNRTISAVYPPGSTFKLVTAAAALTSGKYTKDTVIPAPRTLRLPNSTAVLKNFGGETCSPTGKMTLEAALKVSCNTAFALLGIALGDVALRDQAEAFGFNTTFDTPMTSATSVFPLSLDPAQTAQAAIGQFDVTATPLQMAIVSAAIANNGSWFKPYLVSKQLAPDLSVLDVTQPELGGRAVSPQVAAQLRDMMITVVNQGTGTAAQISGISVAGKTGTAEHGNGLAPHAWFTAFAPAAAPKVAVAVIVEDGGGNTEATGGRVAAPIAREALERTRPSMPSRAESAVTAPKSAELSGKPRPNLWSKSSRPGSKPGWSRCRRRVPLPMQSAMA